MTQQNAAMVEESTAASHSLLQECEELARRMGRFQVGPSASDPMTRAPARKPNGPKKVANIKLIGRGGVAPKLKPPAEQWAEF